MSQGDDYETDGWLKAVFSAFFDPCPLQADFNGLELPWCQYHDQVFVNPPYSNPLPWVKKAISETKNYPGSVVVLLLKHDSSTEWFRLLHEAGARLLLVNKRLKHQTNRSAAFPSVLAVLQQSN